MTDTAARLKLDCTCGANLRAMLNGQATHDDHCDMVTGGDTGWTPFVEMDPPTLASDDPMIRKSWEGARFFHNSHYHVVRRDFTMEEGGQLVHLSIRDNERTTKHDWRDFQRIKNELLGPEEEAVELYPADSRLVDTSNQYHLWCIVGMRWPFGFNERLVMDQEQVSKMNPSITQRPGAGK